MHSPRLASSPYRFLIRELVRRPGARREEDVTFTVPAVLGTDVIAVPEGATAQLSASFEVVTDGVWVSGSFSSEALGECSRCLDEVRREVDVPVQVMYFYPDAELGEDRDANDEYEFDGETIDLEPAVRDAVVTSLPFTPLCDPNCPGLCDQCGARLADDHGHAHEALDPRWAALSALKDGESALKGEQVQELPAVDIDVADRNARSGEKES